MGAYTRRSRAEISQDLERSYPFFARLKKRETEHLHDSVVKDAHLGVA